MANTYIIVQRVRVCVWECDLSFIQFHFIMVLKVSSYLPYVCVHMQHVCLKKRSPRRKNYRSIHIAIKLLKHIFLEGGKKKKKKPIAIKIKIIAYPPCAKWRNHTISWTKCVIQFLKPQSLFYLFVYCRLNLWGGALELTKRFWFVEVEVSFVWD